MERSESKKTNIDILSSLPKQEDLRTAQSMYAVFDGADRLLESSDSNVEVLTDLEKKLCLEIENVSTFEHLVVKAALSKARVQALDHPTHVEIVVPMYHEAIRMSPRSTSTDAIYTNSLAPNENGEDSLLRKHAEMSWLTKGSQLSYQFIFVDDMCDQESGNYAQSIIDENSLSNTKVLFLEEALKNAQSGTLHHEAIENIIATGESIRGGALCLGFAEAVLDTKALDPSTKAVIGYVDADSSYSLTQLGIPLWQIVNSDAKAVTASRQHELTYMEPHKSESQTSQRSPGLIRLKQVVGHLRKNILGPQVPADTQSGFKLLEPETLEATLKQPKKANNFSYDTQLLSRISELYPDQMPIQTFGVVCIDSDELSTANNGVTYFYALQILLVIAEETNFNKDNSDMWLLDYLTENIDNYKLAKKLLEDTTDATEWFPSDSEDYQTLLKVRGKIKTDRDTTAVGDYFTQDIAEDLATLLKKIN